MISLHECVFFSLDDIDHHSTIDSFFLLHKALIAQPCSLSYTLIFISGRNNHKQCNEFERWNVQIRYCCSIFFHCDHNDKLQKQRYTATLGISMFTPYLIIQLYPYNTEYCIIYRTQKRRTERETSNENHVKDEKNGYI